MSRDLDTKALQGLLAKQAAAMQTVLKCHESIGQLLQCIPEDAIVKSYPEALAETKVVHTNEEFFDIPVRKTRSRYPSSETRLSEPLLMSPLAPTFHDGDAPGPDSPRRTASLTPETCWHSVARSKSFAYACAIAITLNILWLGVDANFDQALVLSDAPIFFQVVENVFCCFFVFEILVRVMTFASMWQAFYDTWFMFDLIVVVLMVWETWIQVLIFYLMKTSAYESWQSEISLLRIFRFFRLTRVARVLRLMRVVPEFKTLAKGMETQIRSVVATMGLLFLTIYVYAIVLIDMLPNSARGHFSNDCMASLPMAMHCLLEFGLFPSQADFINEFLEQDFASYVVVVVYMFMMSLAIMNVLIGVLVQVVRIASDMEKETNRKSDLAHKVGTMIKDIQLDTTGEMSQGEFLQVLSTDAAALALEELEIDTDALLDLGDVLFHNKAAIAIEEFQSLLQQLQGSNAAIVKDVAFLRKVLSVEISKLRSAPIQRVPELVSPRQPLRR